jgi:hypothetical protein
MIGGVLALLPHFLAVRFAKRDQSVFWKLTVPLSNNPLPYEFRHVIKNTGVNTFIQTPLARRLALSH